MKTDMTHIEKWTLRITPEEGDNWPDVLVPFSANGAKFRPDVISVTIERGGDNRAALAGYRMKKDGSTGQLRAGTRYGFPPQWAADLVKAERERLNLTDEALGRPQ